MSETAELKHGDLVRVIKDGVYVAISDGSRDRIFPEDELEVRLVNTRSIRVLRTTRMGARSYWIPRIDLELIPTDPDAPKPRKLGEVPEGGISPDDPRLAWLWEDAAKVAYCSEYDKIADRLGIPGRVRSFTVNRTINDLKVSGTFSARSRKEAEAMLDEKLATAGVADMGLTA